MSATLQLIKEIGSVRLAIMSVVAVSVLGAFLFLSVQLSNPAVVPLFSGLDSEDSAKIAAKMETMGVYYEMRSGGSQIMVPAKKVLSIRMGLANEGLPTGRANVGYEIFDSSESIGVSSFVHNVNLLRALEGELGRTIGSFSHVDRARVHLVIPQQDVFSKKRRDPSASVILKMRGNKPLNHSEITAISHLVATAVPGLDVSKITIVDTQGRPFKKGATDASDPAFIASTSEEFVVQYERRIKNVIEELISRSVGVGLVEAQVSAEIDFDRIVTDSETFDPDGRVARSIQSVEERESASGSDGGNVSAGNNLPGGEAGAGGGTASSVERTDEVTNFEVSKTIKKHIKESGTVKRLSVAVLVDGLYEFDEEIEDYVYTPRSEGDLEQIAKLVKSAVGYDESRGDKIEVINMRFTREIQGVIKENKFDWLTRDIGSIIQTIVIGVIVTLLIILIVKPMVGRAFEITKSETKEVELQAALSEEDLQELSEISGEQEEKEKKKSALIDVDKLEERMNESSLTTINDIIERHPEETATILRTWMEGDNK